MPNKKVYLAFDIDGTIFNAGTILQTAIEIGARELEAGSPGLDLRVPSMNEITATLGYPLSEIFSMLYPELDENHRTIFAETWTMNLVKLILARKGELIADAEHVIRGLYAEGYTLLVASNGARDYVEAVLDAYDIKKYFSGPFLYVEDGLADKRGIVKEYVNILEPGIFIMIGDRVTDLDAARSNSIPFIGCAFGHAGLDEIGGEKYIVYRLAEIPGMVKRIIFQ